MVRGSFALRPGLLLLLLNAWITAVASAGIYTDPTYRYTMTLPDDWVAIPASVVDEYTRVIRSGGTDGLSMLEHSSVAGTPIGSRIRISWCNASLILPDEECKVWASAT